VQEQVTTVALSSGIEVGIRGYLPGDDDPIIYAPWCNHIRRVAPFSEFTPEEFREHKHGLLERLVARHGAAVICHKEYPQVVHGWLCGDPFERVCHFLYVKDDFRGKGIARALVDSVFPGRDKLSQYYTHQTRQAPALARKLGFTYDPYRIERYKVDLFG